jgi:hypothetical protein
MTPEQQAAVIAVGDAIRANPRSWSALSDYERAVLTGALMPNPSFHEAQTAYLARWWMPISDEQVAALNAAMPTHRQVAPRAGADGLKYVCADLLSDSLNNGPIAAALPILSELVLTYCLDSHWPEAPLLAES